MNYGKVVLAFAALGLLTQTGCATKIAGLKASESFQYPAIVTGKMAIGGVASAVDQLEESKRNSLGSLLRTELLEERKDYSVAPVGVVTNKLGAAKYKQMIQDYQNTGVLGEPWLRALQEKLGGTRYLTFARIDSDDLSQDRNETSSLDSKGKLIVGSERVVAKTRRSLTVSMHIYDLQRAEEVWSGSVTKALENSQEYEKEKEMSLISLVKAVRGTADATTADKYPYPQAPEQTRLLKLAFEGFAENLPKKD